MPASSPNVSVVFDLSSSWSEYINAPYNNFNSTPVNPLEDETLVCTASPHNASALSVSLKFSTFSGFFSIISLLSIPS